jgi:hypothetical protein
VPNRWTLSPEVYNVCNLPALPEVWRCATENKTKERWLALCEQAANEQDTAKLYALVQEINRLLEEKSLRLNRERETQRNPPTTPP